jgi:hypothetical protein
VCTGATAKVIGLASNIFRDRLSPWNEYPAHRVLHHVILAGRKLLRLALSLELSKSPPQKKI